MVTLLHLIQDSDTSGFFPQLARWHDRERYRVLFASLWPMAPWLQEYLESQGVKCYSCGCRGRETYPLGMLRLMRLMRRERADILHTHLFDPSVVGLLAGYLAHVPVRVVTRHYSDYHTRAHKRFHVRLDQMCTNLSHAAIAVSEHTADVMLDEEKAPASRVRVILNGVDFDRVRLSSPDAPAAIRRQFAPNGEFLMLQVGRLHPEKGYEYLFQALPTIRERAGRPVRLLVAGAGPFEEEYKRQVHGAGLDDVVTFVGFRRDAPDLMAATDVLVLASVAEAFGLVLTEALYMGAPVVATQVGGIPEIIEDGVDGLLVPPASPDALAGAVLKLIHDDGLRRRLAGAGREKVARRFGFEQMVRQYEQVYEELLAPEKLPGPGPSPGEPPQPVTGHAEEEEVALAVAAPAEREAAGLYAGERARLKDSLRPPARAMLTQPARRVLAEPGFLRAAQRGFVTTAPVILCYHSVLRGGAPDLETVTPKGFVDQMEWLARHGFQAVTVAELVGLLQRGKVERPTVALTFDDGYLDNYVNAVPVLEQLGFRATFFIVTSFIGQRSFWNPPDYIGHRPLMSAAQLREMATLGMEIGSHTHCHHDLTRLSADEVWDEVYRSREVLMDELGTRVRGFAPPHGRSNALITDAVGRAGYEYQALGGRFAGNRQGVDPLQLLRVTVAGGDSLREFGKKASGAYHWLSDVAKKVRSSRG